MVNVLGQMLRMSELANDSFVQASSLLKLINEGKSSSAMKDLSAREMSLPVGLASSVRRVARGYGSVLRSSGAFVFGGYR